MSEVNFFSQDSKISKKYTMDCEYWGDGNTRHAYMFHLTGEWTYINIIGSL